MALLLPTPAQAASTVVFRGNQDCRDINFTYDNAYFNNETRRLLTVLSDQKIKATFYLVGNALDNDPAMVQEIAELYPVHNHTQTHPHMTQLTKEQMRQEIVQAENAIPQVTGVNPEPLFRPPYGEYNSTVLDVAEEEGYPYTVMWTIDTLDWQYPPAETIRRRIVDNAKPGAIVLMHGYLANTVDGTRLAAQDLRAQGYQFVSTLETLGIGRSERDFGGDTYVVQSGDFMGDIAACHNLSIGRLQAYNEVTFVAPGYVLNIPHIDEVIIHVNGVRQSFPVYPRMINARSLAHVRLAEQLGATVGWDGTKVIITKGAKQIEITPGSRTASVNGVPTDMGETAFMENDRVLAPVRFLAEQLGATVGWDAETWTVLINQ